MWKQFITQCDPDNSIDFAKLDILSFKYSTPDTIIAVFVFDGANNPNSAMYEKIISNLIKYKHITSKNIIEQHNDVMSPNIYFKLESIMYQGVLFIDSMLFDKQHELYAEWSSFIIKFIKKLSSYKTDRNRANNIIIFKDNIPDEDIFKQLNDSLINDNKLPIKWDMQQTVLAFTDGGCVANGTPNAIASYAAYIMTGHNNQIEVSGIVESFEYVMISDDPLMGFKVTNKPVLPTNNRGEYLAWCWVLLVLLRSHTYCAVEVVSDCNLFIKTMTEWLPNRKLKKTESGLKNYDLVCIADILLSDLRAKTGMTRMKLTHINSHKEAPPKTNKFEYFKWLGNTIVDKRASELIEKFKNNPKSSKGPFIQFKKSNQTVIPLVGHNMALEILKFE
jgi:ribonuclease HI